MVPTHLLTHSLLFAVLANGYLLLMMVTNSPRVWGYSDYSEEIKAKVPQGLFTPLPGTRPRSARLGSDMHNTGRYRVGLLTGEVRPAARA